MTEKPKGVNYLTTLNDDEPLPGRRVITINCVTGEKHTLDFGIEVNEEFAEILKTTISVEAQIEMAHKIGWIAENALLKQLGLETQ